MQRSRCALATCRWAVAHAAAALLLALPAGAQTVTGRVLDGDLLAPVAGATVVALDSELSVVAETRSDSIGVFAFGSLATGDYVFQAHIAGRSAPPTPPITLEPAMEPITLVLPSELSALGLYCPIRPRTAALVGVVYERGADVVIPGARVAVAWSEGADSMAATTDAAGRYRFCGVPAGTAVDVRISALGRRQTMSLDVPVARVARADLAFDLGAGSSSLRVRATRPLPDAGSSGILSGQLLDAASGAPIEQAIVRLHGREEPAYSTVGGDFRFIGVAPGVHVLEVEHLGYGTQREVISIATATATDIEMKLAPQAIALESIEARGDAAVRRAMRASSSATEIVAGSELAVEELRGGRVADLAKTRFPSLDVSEGIFQTRYGITRGVCMESIRRNMSLRGSGGGNSNIPFCDTISVIVDGIPTSDPVGFLGSVTLADFESVSFMNDLDAGISYGLHGGGGGGVLLLYTRGRGPYVSQERNVPPP